MLYPVFRMTNRIEKNFTPARFLVWDEWSFPLANALQQPVDCTFAVSAVGLDVLFVMLIVVFCFTFFVTCCPVFILLESIAQIAQNSLVCCFSESLKLCHQQGLANLANTYVRQNAFDVE